MEGSTEVINELNEVETTENDSNLESIIEENTDYTSSVDYSYILKQINQSLDVIELNEIEEYTTIQEIQSLYQQNNIYMEYVTGFMLVFVVCMLFNYIYKFFRMFF